MEGFRDNAPVPDDLDDLERQHLGKGALNEIDVDELNHLEFDSDYSVDEEFAELEEEEFLKAAEGVVIENDQDWSSVLTSNRPKNNTGGKGVLADHKEARKITRRRNETKALKQREAWKKAGYGAQGDPLQTVQQRDKTRIDEESDSDSEGSDDEFFQNFRALRLQQLSSVAGLPQYGTLRAVDKFQFVDEVDHADKRTAVVIHIYEDYLLACQRMNLILSTLATRYPHVNFLRLKATEADQTLSHSVLPAFLVYKGGKLAGHAAINAEKTEFQNEKFTEDDVEWFLASKYGVQLPGVDVSDQERRRRKGEIVDDDPRNLIVADGAKGTARFSS